MKGNFTYTLCTMIISKFSRHIFYHSSMQFTVFEVLLFDKKNTDMNDSLNNVHRINHHHEYKLLFPVQTKCKEKLSSKTCF